MRISWLGHSCFLIEEGGIRLVTDPFNPVMGFPEPRVHADLVTVSHEHDDHNYVQALLGDPVIFRGPGRHEAPTGWKIEGFTTFHDDAKGQKRGLNTLFLIEAGAIRILHLGDLGHLPPAEQLAAIGRVDVLMPPVGGFYTIDAKVAYDIVQALKPCVILPMHYRTAANPNFPVTDEKPFLALVGEAEGPLPMVELSSDSLPSCEHPRIILLEYPA